MVETLTDGRTITVPWGKLTPADLAVVNPIATKAAETGAKWVKPTGEYDPENKIEVVSLDV